MVTSPIRYQKLYYSDGNSYMAVNVINLAGYTPNLFQYELLDIFVSIVIILSAKREHDSNNPIFHPEPETPTTGVECYQQSAINCELVTIDDTVFKDGRKKYHLWADEWDCDCKEEDKTEWCFCGDNK
jgi:hypothetical protein